MLSILVEQLCPSVFCIGFISVCWYTIKPMTVAIVIPCWVTMLQSLSIWLVNLRFPFSNPLLSLVYDTMSCVMSAVNDSCVIAKEGDPVVIVTGIICGAIGGGATLLS